MIQINLSVTRGKSFYSNQVEANPVGYRQRKRSGCNNHGWKRLVTAVVNCGHECKTKHQFGSQFAPTWSRSDTVRAL